MGFTLNGNTSLVLVSLLAVITVAAITAVVITGHTVPEIFTVVLTALASSVGGGAVVNHVNQHDTGTIATAAAQTVVDAQKPAQTP